MIWGNKIILDADFKWSLARKRRNDEWIRDFCRQHTLISHYEQDNWYKNLAQRNDVKMFGIQVRENNDSVPYAEIGVCGFTSIDLIHRKAEFSLYIDQTFHGHGYAKEALFLLINHGFRDWGFNRIWGEVFDYNHAARKAFPQLGFEVEGTLKESYWKRGKFIDSIMIGLTQTRFNWLMMNGFYKWATGGDGDERVQATVGEKA